MVPERFYFSLALGVRGLVRGSGDWSGDWSGVVWCWTVTIRLAATTLWWGGTLARALTMHRLGGGRGGLVNSDTAEKTFLNV